MKKSFLTFAVIVVILMLTSTVVYTLISERNNAQEKDFNTVLAERIYDAVGAELRGPILVSKAMANSTYVSDFLKEENKIARDRAVGNMKAYLHHIMESGGYESAYLISARTNCYYSYKGLNKVINPDTDAFDRWFPDFAKSGVDYRLEVDRDQVTGDYTIFVNARLEDKQGSFLGVCGVGIHMDHLQEIFKQYEEEYTVKINLVDEDGLVQVDVSSINIENTYQGSKALSDKDNLVYSKKGVSGYIITKYISELDWYLVVQCEGYQTDTDRFFTGFLIWTVLAIAIILGSGYLLLYKAPGYGYRTINTGEYDELSQLPNRNYFKNMYGEKGRFNTTRYKVVAVFDIDGFKQANDTIDGDAMIKDLTEMAKELIGDNGEIFRWGGDEFVVLMEWSMDFSYELCRRLCSKVEKDGRVTISAGLTDVRLADSIKTNYYRAKQACYLVKEMGGNGVKKG